MFSQIDDGGGYVEVEVKVTVAEKAVAVMVAAVIFAKMIVAVLNIQKVFG